MKYTTTNGILAVLIGILAFVAVTLLGGLITLLIWNYILVPVVAAVGLGVVPTIGIWIAIGLNIILSIVGNLFR